MYPTFYKVSFWDDIDQTIKEVCSVLFADTYAEAANKIEEYYGGENINRVEIFQHEKYSLIELPEELGEAIHKHMSF